MAEAKEKWIEIILSTPADLSDALANFLNEIDTHGVFEEELEDNSFNNPEKSQATKHMTAFLPDFPESAEKITALEQYIKSLIELFPNLEKPSFSARTVVNPGWEHQWKKYFKPLRLGKSFIIKPTWERYSTDGRDIVIDIDPGMAFGTGQHPSTAMCITALEDIMLKDRSAEKWNVMDVGTGTGILAICCAKLGAEKIIAVDIDPKAIEIASKNIVINDVHNKIEVLNLDVSFYKGAFDLIIANLTSGTLISLQSHLISMLNPGGYIITSGITEHDAKNVEKVFCTDNVEVYSVDSEKEWVCYVFHKKVRNF